jgi:membrane protease subunit HflK
MVPSWLAGAGIFRSDPPKSPWGGPGKGGNGDGENGDSGGGPRNPWSLPPDGKRSRPGAGGSFDDLFRRARGGGFGGGSGIPGDRRIWWAVAAALVLLWILFTSIHLVRPQERGVVTTLGRFSGTLEPGWKLTLPAPLADVDTIDVTAIRDEKFPDPTAENLMLTGDQNIIDIAYLVQWRVRDPADYVFQIAKPQETVRATAETAMRAVIATATLNDAITSGRGRIEAKVQILMQQILDEYNSGIEIQSVSIQKAAAPQAVDEDFKAVTAAQQQAQANKNNANAYAQQVLAAAQGDAAEFDKIYEQYKLAPKVTRDRLYYETMEQVLSRTDKTIVEAPGVTPYLALPDLKRKGAADAAPEVKK